MNSDSDLIAMGIRFFDNPVVIACDAKCDKAWGMNNRPKVHLRAETDPLYEDDYEYLADEELGTAPADPSTYEGGHAKPTHPDHRLNKWCCRECERSRMFELFEQIDSAKLPDFSKRLRNMPGDSEGG